MFGASHCGILVAQERDVGHLRSLAALGFARPSLLEQPDRRAAFRGGTNDFEVDANNLNRDQFHLD